MICNTCKLDSAVWIFLPDGSTSCSECTRSLVTALEQQVEELRNELTDGIAFVFNMMEPRAEADLKDTLDEQLQVLEASYVARRQALIQAESTAKLALAQAQIKHEQLAAERTRARTQLYLARLRTSDENLTLNALKQAALLGTAIKRIFEWVDKSNAVVLLACPACGAAWTQDRDEGSPASGWRLCPRCLRELPDSWEQGAAAVRAAAVARQYAGTAEYMEAIDTASDRRG